MELPAVVAAESLRAPAAAFSRARLFLMACAARLMMMTVERDSDYPGNSHDFMILQNWNGTATIQGDPIELYSRN